MKLASVFKGMECRKILTPRIGFAPEYNWLAIVFRGPKNIMKLDSETVQMSYVQWSEIVVESIV